MPLLNRAAHSRFSRCCLPARCSRRAVHADIANAPGAELRVDLYTYGPGEIYWERFGHDALVLTDMRDGQAIAFNYGLFDFNQKNFVFNFARGRMNYLAAAWPVSDDLATYEGEGRWIVAHS